VNVLPHQKLPSDSGAQRKRVVMNKAFHTLVDDRTDVSVETGLRAAEKLQSVLDGHEQGIDIARMRIELGRIIDAVKSTVPQSMWGEIVEKLDQMEQYPESIVDETDAYGESDDVFDPTDFAEEDDEL
jgi:hypothetical protein